MGTQGFSCSGTCRHTVWVKMYMTSHKILTGTINRQSRAMKYKLLLFIKSDGEQGATCFGS